MRFVLVLLVAALTSVPPAFAGDQDKVPDTQELAAMAAKAEQATPRERCYLYAKLVRAMTEVAGHQLDQGDVSDASISLKTVQDYTSKIHVDLTDHSKKLKDAQIMMRRTAFRLKELMMSGGLSEQPVLEATLKQLNQVQSQMMLAVFQK